MPVIAILLFVLMVFPSCVKEDSVGCFVSNGKPSSLKRDVSPFREIEINNVFDVYIVGDSLEYVEISGGENILNGITSVSDNGRLIIDNANTCNWMRGFNKDISVRIHYKAIDLIKINGECNVYSENCIYADTLFIDVQSGASLADIETEVNFLKLKIHGGTGKFTLKGKSGLTYFYSHGNSHIEALELNSDRVHLVNKSTGDISVNVKDFLHVEYLGRGDVYYKGNPSEIYLQEQSGEGKLIHLD